MTPTDLLQEIRRLADAQTAIPVVSSRAYRLRAVSCDTPLLVIPFEGSKRVHPVGMPLDCAAGGFVFWQAACTLDVENRPDRSGPYRALVIAFPWPVVELARSLLARRRSLPVASRQTVVLGPLAPIGAALLELLRLADADELARDHRLVGVLLALAEAGHDGFRRALDPSLSARVRLLVAQDPAREWTSADFEDALGMSGATLRRRLAGENTTLRALLRDVRLHHALALLQTSRRPLKTVALAAGYRSTPTFSRRFAERFGIDPATVMHTAD